MRWAKISLISIDEHLNKLTELKPPHAANGPITEESLSLERSRQMLKAVNEVAPYMKNTIYKVGNDHIRDIKNPQYNMNNIGPKIKVMDKDEYEPEYETLRASKKSKGKQPKK